jgi:hypothetical protein
MTRWCVAGVLVLALATSASAGEILFKNGRRLAGEIATQVLLVSTGSDVVEIAPGDVAVLTPEEVRLKDGRVVRGTLVGGQLRTRTDLGELAIELDQLQVFRAETAPEPAPPAAPTAVATPLALPPPAVPVARPASESRSAPSAPRGPGQVAEGARTVGRGFEDTARGVGATVVEGADRIHDGFKLLGVTIWEGMKSVGRAAQSVFAP